VNSLGVVTGITLTNGGSGYTAPVVWFSLPINGSSAASATATVSNTGVSGITITNPGTGYTNPVITLSGGGGSGATASAALSNGVVTGVTITNGGTAPLRAGNAGAKATRQEEGTEHA